MADWDADSPELRRNLTKVLRDIRDSARRRDTPTIDAARTWHSHMMAGLEVPDPAYVGAFRGERGLKTVRVRVGSGEGVSPNAVRRALTTFEKRLKRAVAALDRRYPRGRELDADGLAAVIDLSAWVHAEWVRIHPFANGNGRTARLWANSLFMRYGLPPAVRLRTRPVGDYGVASARAMNGRWQSTASVFRQMLLDEIGSN